jgi:hypothetical protein
MQQWGKLARHRLLQPCSSEPFTTCTNIGTKMITKGQNPEHRGAKIFFKFGSMVMFCLFIESLVLPDMLGYSV